MKEHENREMDEDIEGYREENDRMELGVHVLSEFVFCRRAGVIAYEEGGQDSGEERGETPRLDYLPDYEIRLIEEGLKERWGQVWCFLTYAPPVALVIVLVGMFVDWLIAAAIGVSSGFPVWWLVRVLQEIATLSRRLETAKSAQGEEPDLTVRAVQDVNWWKMIKAGFEPVPCSEPYRDHSLGLVGKPWRVLQRGSMRIPVFRKREGDATIFKQHYIRMAAYCELIRACEGAEAPYGVVLFGREYGGVALVPEKEDRENMLSSLREAQKIIRGVQTRRRLPGEPKKVGVCKGCPWGRPRVYRKGKTETVLAGKTLTARLTKGLDKQVYHSTCGDRYGNSQRQWVPLHRKAEEKGLGQGN